MRSLLSQALHETYSATGQQLEQAGRRLRLCQHSLGALWHQARQARQGAEELRGAVQGLKVEELALQLQTHGGTQALQGAQAGLLLLAERLTELERTLASLARRGPRHGAVELAALKMHVEQQSLALRALAGSTQHQQQRAARQAQQLARLQEQQLQHRTRT
ncbi:angiopoietin-like protein 8 [Pelodiscus sinensis]|uniref:angiopoietin-like protein 8 n=1 Tax=Pelodiscus sinensis TaxID=13735 RepID=UPI003F6BFA22